MEKHKKEKKKLGLSTKIFIALLTGAVCGVLIHYYMPEGYFRDTILINGILLLIMLPYLFAFKFSTKIAIFQ